MSGKQDDAAYEKLRAENDELRRRLEEAEDALRAIREGEVDAVIVSGTKGDRVFSLAGTENLHRIMVETMNEAGIATSPDGTILYCNHRACALLQRADSELMGQHLSEIVAPHHLDRISLLLDNASRGITHDRIMFLAPDESPVPMQMWASRAETLEGPMITLVGTDLSLLEADQALLAHLEEQQNALHAREQELTVAHRRLSSDLEAMSSLQRIASQFVRGEDPANIAGDALDAAIRVSAAFSGDVQLVDPDTGEHYIAAHRSFEPWRVEFWDKELATRASACSAAWESGQQTVVEDVETSPLFAGTAGTPQLDAHRRAGVRSIVSTPMVSGDGRVMGVLTVHFKETGAPDARTMQWVDLIARETGDIIDRAITVVRRDQLVQELEQTQRLLRESHFALEAKVKERTLLSEERGEKLRAMADALTTAEQEERRRLAQVLHDDLQQMLVAIRLRLASLEATVAGTPLSPAVRSVSEIVDNAITSSRSLTVELSPPILRESLADIIAWLANWFETRHDVRVEVHVDPGVVEPTDEAKKFLFQAVRELIVNIRKHAGVDQAHVRIFAAGDDLGIEVSDAGRGFNPEEVRNNARASFGLSNIRERVEAMGGALELKSTPGRGTTCTIRLPVAAAGTRAAADSVAAPTHANGPIRVLVVDDHTIFRRGLISILNNYPDIKVVGEASDGEHGVKQAGELMPDVVIMDLAMPRMNGIEATREIKSRFMSIDVIALSFQESEHARASVVQAGARAYFTKSGPLDQLLSAIRERRTGDERTAAGDNGHTTLVPPVKPRERRRANAPLRKIDHTHTSPRTRKA